MNTSKSLIDAAAALSNQVNHLEFADPVSYVYNPLDYAWRSHRRYIEKFGASKKRVVFMGMNPGPWGMSQTGVPFGEISFVRDWMGISDPVEKPKREHPKRPIVGFECEKSEVSGRRLWGLFAERYPDPSDFFCRAFRPQLLPARFHGGKLAKPNSRQTPPQANLRHCSTPAINILENASPC